MSSNSSGFVPKRNVGAIAMTPGNDPGFGQTAHICSCYYIIAGGYVSAYVIASGCVNSLLKTYSVILLPSLQPSTTFLRHVKSKILVFKLMFTRVQ